MSDQIKNYGRKPKLTPEKLLEAIREYASIESSLLGEKLGVNRSTVWRCMQKIPKEQVENILIEIAEQELKPAETEYNVFIQIPMVKQYDEKLMRKVVDKYRRRMLHMLHRICVFLKKHPARLTLEDGAKLIEETELGLKEGKARTPFKSVAELQRGLRCWFLRKGISREMLSSKGIDSYTSKVDRERAKARLTPEQRDRFMEVLSEKIKGYSEVEQLEWLTLPKYLYYCGARIFEALGGKIEKIDKGNNGIWKHHIIGKRNIKWSKRITGELRDRIARLLELRENPDEGLLFSLFSNFSNMSSRTERVGSFFKEVYEEANIPKKIWDGMPCHIWRHTACQDLLEATNYNYDQVAEILGWVSVDTMKKHYGAIGERVIDKALLEAMGQQIEWEKKEFKF